MNKCGHIRVLSGKYRKDIHKLIFSRIKDIERDGNEMAQSINQDLKPKYQSAKKDLQPKSMDFPELYPMRSFRKAIRMPLINGLIKSFDKTARTKRQLYKPNPNKTYLQNIKKLCNRDVKQRILDMREEHGGDMLAIHLYQEYNKNKFHNQKCVRCLPFEDMMLAKASFPEKLKNFIDEYNLWNPRFLNISKIRCIPNTERAVKLKTKIYNKPAGVKKHPLFLTSLSKQHSTQNTQNSHS